MSSAQEPMFYLIHAIRAGYDSFTVEGIFTKLEDAEEWVKELEKLPYVEAVARPQHLPLQTVKMLILDDTLKELAEVLNERL
jgi:hypothetical protein